MTDEGKAFVVVIEGRQSAMPWCCYPTRDEAESAAQQLRLHGIDATVSGPDDLPQSDPKQ